VSNFADRDPEYPDLPTALCEWDPGFARSPEAAAVAQDFDLPTVVADAFGDYVLRLNSTGDDDQALERALGALERMASSEEPDLQNCALTGLIERLPSEAPGLIGALGPASADLYGRWDKRL
jgi:hypothetical protein